MIATNEHLAAKQLEPVRLELVEGHLEDEDLLEMVNADLVPAIVIDSHKALFWEQILPNLQLHQGFPLSEGGSVGWAFRHNSPQFKALVDEFLRGHRQGTLFGNILFKRYLRNTGYIVNSLAGTEMVKFNTAAALFKQYAARYDFDWLMLIAQAYQESQLDNSRVSPAGAVGVMQLLPSTAADKHIQIDNIRELEKQHSRGREVHALHPGPLL